jgi:hypothetical protein
MSEKIKMRDGDTMRPLTSLSVLPPMTSVAGIVCDSLRMSFYQIIQHRTLTIMASGRIRW